MERPDPFQNRQNYEEIELTILDPNSEEPAPQPTEEPEASQDAIISEQDTVAPQESSNSDPPCDTNQLISEEVNDQDCGIAESEPADAATEEPAKPPAAIEAPEEPNQPLESVVESVVESDVPERPQEEPEPIAEPVDHQAEPRQDEDMKDVTPVHTEAELPSANAREADKVDQSDAVTEPVEVVHTPDEKASACETPKADVAMLDDQGEATSPSSTALEHRHKRPRRKQSAPSSSKKKSRSAAAGPSVEDNHCFISEWEKCLEEFYRTSIWNGSTGPNSKWAELKTKTVEGGEVWMHPPINLPTRYLAEFLQLMYSEIPDAAPEWKILPASLINVAAGTERRLQTHRSSHPLPFATPVIVSCRNEYHVHYLLPLLLVAHTALKVIQNSISIRRVAPPILKAPSLDVITQCPTFSTQLLLLGHESVPVSQVISQVCIDSWPKLEAAMKKHVVDESSRPARRKVLRAREEDLSDAEVSAIKNAVENCLREIEEQRKLVFEALTPKITPNTALPLSSLANFCKAEKTFEAGDVVLRNVPCQMLLTYSAVLRLETYKFFGIQPAILEFEFDDSLDGSDTNKNRGSAVWRELRKEHYKLLDQRIQIFVDFTLDKDQGHWLMSRNGSTRAAKPPNALSKTSQMIANECLLSATSEPESGYEANLSIDLNIDGVVKCLAGPDNKSNVSSVEFHQSDSLVNFVATRTIKGSDQLKLALGTQWRLVDSMYFSEE